METIKHQNYEKESQVDGSPFSLKLDSKYLTSLLLFTALLICSSRLPVMIKTVEFFTLINKNYMFLVCNGLLVFIVKNSGLITTSHHETSPSSVKETYVKNHLTKAPEVAEVKTEEVSEIKKPVREMEEKSLVVVKDEEEAIERHEENNENAIVEEKSLVDVKDDEEAVERHEESNENAIVEKKSLVDVKDDEEAVERHEESNENGVVVADEVYEEGEVVELLSAEELHKKCEDFIRKMKEGIRYENQQLVQLL